MIGQKREEYYGLHGACAGDPLSIIASVKGLFRYGTLVVCLLPLAGCASSPFRLRSPFERTANGFWYRHDCRGLCDLYAQEAERPRLRALADMLKRHGHCPKDHTIDSRKPLGVTLSAVPDIVAYEGRCRGR